MENVAGGSSALNFLTCPVCKSNKPHSCFMLYRGKKVCKDCIMKMENNNSVLIAEEKQGG
jgi:recombinational DNA repair protein (RecF pathway)